MTNLSQRHIRPINKVVRHLKETKDHRPQHNSLHTFMVRRVVFCDGSFGNSKDLSSQLGYIISLTDDSARGT